LFFCEKQKRGLKGQYLFFILFVKENINEGGNIIMNNRIMNLLGVCVVLFLVIGLTLIPVSKVDAYYGGGYSGVYGSSLYGGLYGSSLYGGGLYGSSLYGGGLYGSSLYGGLMGGLYGGYSSLLGGLMGGLYGGYGGLMGGLYGGYGGLMGGLSSPFGAQNLYYPVQTTGGLTYQVPYMQIAPLLGIAGLYNQLFPNLFNPQPSPAPIVNVSTPATQFVTFPTPVGTFPVT
jgi:hypothetical protein